MAFKTLGWDVPTFPMHDVNRNIKRNPAVSPANAAHQLPVSGDAAKVYAVNIANVAVDLTSSAVRNACSKYGKLLHVVRITDTDWAIVHYGNLSEANEAVRGINTTKSLGWHAKLSKADKSDKSGNLEKPETKQKDMNWLRNRIKTNGLSSVQDAKTPERLPGITSSSLDFGLCALCKSSTQSICSRCYEFYCSDTCQRKDWDAHQHHCIPIPALVAPAVTANHKNAKNNNPNVVKPTKLPKVNLSQRLANLTIAAKPSEPVAKVGAAKTEAGHRDRPKNRALYMITHIHNHRTLSIRSMNPNDNERYLKMLSDCVDYEPIADPLKALPEKGEMVLAEFMGTHYRACVLKAKSEQLIEVIFVDFGNKEKKTLAQLKTLRADLQVQQLNIYRVRLAGLDSKLNDESAMVFLNELLDECKTLRLVYENEKATDSSPVTLIDVETKQAINDRVAKLNTVQAHGKT